MDNFALEMLRELKAQSKRWFVVAIVELVILISTNIGWLVYESQYEEITQDEQYIEDINNSNNSSYIQTIN